MPVHSCPDCNGMVSDSASACPHCGRPTQSQALVQSSQPQVIEQTGKNLKGLGCLANIMILVGLMTLFGLGCDATTDPVTRKAAGGIIFGIGFVLGVYYKLAKWWHHD